MSHFTCCLSHYYFKVYLQNIAEFFERHAPPMEADIPQGGRAAHARGIAAYSGVTRRAARGGTGAHQKTLINQEV
jgi:hypothetical protein